MYHLRLKGNHYQMGVKRGNIFKKGGITFPLHLDEFQMKHGKESEKILNKFFPEVCEEIRGLSETIGVDYIEFVSWMLCMGCCMYNLEENVPVEIRGCTAFAYSKDNRVIYGRNNDLPPYLKNGSSSEIYAPENGNRFNLTTSSFINGEEGLNEHGLAVAQLPIASNYNILIADKSGKMVVVECTPNIKKIREAKSVDDGYLVCTVNSFISDELKPYDFAKGDDYHSYTRYSVVMDNCIKNVKNADPVVETQKLLKGEYGFMCQYDDEPDFETVWSSIFDLSNLMIYRAEGDPRRKKFITDIRLHNIVLGRKDAEK